MMQAIKVRHRYILQLLLIEGSTINERREDQIDALAGGNNNQDDSHGGTSGRLRTARTVRASCRPATMQITDNWGKQLT